MNEKNILFPVRLSGLLGKALKRSCEKRLKTVDYHLLVEPFHYRNENDNAWRCEFWGKVVRSAILSNVYLDDPDLADRIETTVAEIMGTQTPDGCISTYPEDKQLGGWDIWGRKYVLLGLLRYYDCIAPEEEVKKCCVRMLDHLIGQLASSGKTILDFGQHEGLAAASILGAVVGVYRISGEERFLDFARKIAESGCSKKHNIFEAASAGTIPCELGNGKSYEMTSCFQGLAELYEFDPRPEYKDACEKYFASVRDREIFITGVGGGRGCEYWGDGAWAQTQNKETLGETCVTTTWLHYCERIAGLTHRVSPASEMERSLYNGILGAMAPDGTRWVHANPTPLTGGGSKVAAVDQIDFCFHTPFGGNDCCRAQGPEGLALSPRLALMRSGEDSLYLNFYEPLTARVPGLAEIEVKGNYPLEPKTRILVKSEKPFALNLRVPPFLKEATLNGARLDTEADCWLTLNRQWSQEDVLELEFDLSVREVASPDGHYTAFLRGPLLLAEDSRGDVPHALCHESVNGRELIDYITAGDEMRKENTLTVWFPREK